MKTTKSIIVIATALSIGLAGSLSATPRSKQIGTPNSEKAFETCRPSGSVNSSGENSHLKAGPRSKR